MNTEKEVSLEERIEQIFESGWVNEFNYLENLMQETRSCLYKLQQELQRKDNNWNKLKKWCNECIENHIIARKNGETTISDTFFEIVLDKIKELESK